MKRISRGVGLPASAMCLQDSSMRLTNVDREEHCLGNDTKRLVVQALRLSVEAKHPNVGTPGLADEAKHLKVEVPILIAGQTSCRGTRPA